MRNVPQLLRIVPLALLVNGVPALAGISFEKASVAHAALQTPFVQSQIGDTERDRSRLQRSRDQWGGIQYPEALDASNISTIYQFQGSYADALDYYQQSLASKRELGDRAGEANTLNNIGTIYGLQGSYAEALDFSQQSLTLFRDLGDRAGEAKSLNNIGSISQLQGRYAEALDYYQQSLELFLTLGDRASEANTLNNIGTIYGLQGSYEDALNFSEQSLMLSIELGSRAVEAKSLNSIGTISQLQGRYVDALKYYQQSLAIKRDLGDRAGEAIALGNIGISYQYQGRYTDALDYYQQSLAIKRNLGDRPGEANTLGNIGVIYRFQDRYTDALDYYQQSLAIKRDLGDRAGEAVTLGNIAFLFETQEQPALAIAFFKQAVTTYESIRNSNRDLSQELKESYKTTIEERYRRLADLLLQQDRILEAQQVLDLLKVQELDGYLKGIRGTGNTLSILTPEQAILERYNELTATAIELGQELKTLRNTLEAERSSEQQQRIKTLVDLQKDLKQAFINFADSTEVRTHLDQLTDAVQKAIIDPSLLPRLQRELPDLNAALIYPLILKDRLEIVFMLPGSPPLRRTIENIPNTKVNQTILDLRQALDDPNQDPLPAAQQLYQWLIEPIESDLDQAGVDSLIYAPDGQLRYVPLAALHSGDAWLIERYAINNITTESLTELDDAPDANPRVLAGAFTDTGITYPIEIDGNTVSFSGLPFAGTELDNLETTQPEIKPLRDRNFTLDAVEGIMNEYEILHFATHAAFVNSNPEDSFILFGNGDRPNLLDIGKWDLSNVDLVVLSACETGLDGFGNGAEILGMGYQFQSAGAGAVMASLWAVSDRGTQDLMGHFYDHLGQGQPKAKALQQAQRDLINGDSTIDENDPQRGLALFNQTAILPENLQGLRHPHYWAPFILIGNGL